MDENDGEAVSGSGSGSEKVLPGLERGKDLSRIFAFTDGVFAIAITLLVLQIEVPQGLTSNTGFLDFLSDKSANFIAYGISFAVIGRYWIASHRSMRMVGEYDQRLLVLTLLYLAFIVMMPFSSQLLGEYADTIPLAVVFYIVNLVAINVTLGFMFRHILDADLVHHGYERQIELGIRSILFTAVFFAATIPFAWVLGGWTPALWLLLAFNPYQESRKHRTRGPGNTD